MESLFAHKNNNKNSELRLTKMRVLFVNVIDDKIPIQMRYYPLSFGYLYSYCQKQGYTIDESYTEKVDDKVLNDIKPQVVALTSITGNYNLAIAYAKKIKKHSPNIKVLIGGTHISAVPQSLSPDMDVGVIGEGEQTFLELVQNDFEASSNLKGIVYWEDGVFNKTADRSLIEPLDSIPHPKRTIAGVEQRDAYIFTSRGCAYKCIFCSSTRFWKKVRFHSPEYVAEEISQIKSLGATHVNIYDDTFILDLNRVRQIKDLVKDLGLSYTVAVRANLVTQEVAALLKEMNVKNVGIGFESNSERILKYLQKGNTPEDNQRAVDIIRKYNLHLNGSFIKGVPTETKEDLKKTNAFIRKNKIPYDMYRLMRFPNTPLYEGDENWDKCKVHYCIPKARRIRRTMSAAKSLVYNTLNIS